MCTQVEIACEMLLKTYVWKSLLSTYVIVGPETGPEIIEGVAEQTATQGDYTLNRQLLPLPTMATEFFA